MFQFSVTGTGISSSKMKNPIHRLQIVQRESQIALDHTWNITRVGFPDDRCNVMAGFARGEHYAPSYESASAGDENGSHYCTL
jgi:hypothetical protein